MLGNPSSADQEDPMNRLPETPVVDYSDTAARHLATRRRGSIAPGLGVLALAIAIVLAIVLF
jgi:hypothetical protein